MKKIIFLMILLLNINIFAQKLTTNGKHNLDRLVGYWTTKKPSDVYTAIRKKNKIWEIGIECWGENDCPSKIPMKWTRIENYKNGALKTNLGDNIYFYFAYDTRLRAYVVIDENFNIIDILDKKLSESPYK